MLDEHRKPTQSTKDLRRARWDHAAQMLTFDETRAFQDRIAADHDILDVLRDMETMANKRRTGPKMRVPFPSRRPEPMDRYPGS